MKTISKRLAALVLASCMTCGMAAGASAASVVASIGNKNYTSLNAALRAVKTGETVVLKSNVNNANETQTVGTGKGASFFASHDTAKSFTIDLNGHTITAGKESEAGLLIYADENAQNLSITLKNGTISASGDDVSGILIMDDNAVTATTVTLANMTVKATGEAGVDCWDSALVVQSANVQGRVNAIYAENATVNLTAGQFTATDSDIENGGEAIFVIDSEGTWAGDTVQMPGAPAVIRPTDWKINPASTVTITNFADVPSGKWYHDYVYKMASQGVVNGANAWTFNPDGKVTREEFAQILAGAAGADLSAYKGKTSFKDVAASRWSAPAIEWAKEIGVVNGTGNGKFTPAASITRQEACVMLYQYQKKIMNMPVKDIVSVGTYPDSSKVASWAKEAVQVMLREGVMSGVSGNGKTTISPNSTATRAQACKLIAALLEAETA
ncbi:MAG: S-layer homology domain-containing protein [Eubacteriales bacterium]|nr:S-layer homology domain-containing protein [Eubacteriales bacterium]